MKKHILLLALFLTTLFSFGQERKETREKIKVLKVAFLTEQLSLTSEEAQKFWPIYNKHQEELYYLRNKGRFEIKQKLKEVGDLDTLDEVTSKKLVLLKLELDKKMVVEKENFISKVSEFLSYKKIMKLNISEREFARKLMRKYGRDRKPRKNK